MQVPEGHQLGPGVSTGGSLGFFGAETGSMDELQQHVPGSVRRHAEH